MCRWMAYLGEPIRAEDLVFRPVHSIIDQSLHARLTGVTTNGDGFGIGWYADGSVPSCTRLPILRGTTRTFERSRDRSRPPCCSRTSEPPAGGPVQRSNCHPFRHEGWLWMHNGSLANFKDVRRELLMAVDPALFPGIEGSTDSEALFYLALTFGLREDPPAAVARAVGLVEDIGRRNGVQYPVHMTVATSDGESIWLFRYSSEKSTSSLYFSTDVRQLRQLHPELEVLNELSVDTRFVVSEPLRDLPGAWSEVPDGSWGRVRRGEQEIQPFTPVHS